MQLSKITSPGHQHELSESGALQKKHNPLYSQSIKSRRGEIGIHDRLKIYWGQLRKGSSPFAGMFFTLPICRYQPSII